MLCYLIWLGHYLKNYFYFYLLIYEHPGHGLPTAALSVHWACDLEHSLQGTDAAGPGPALLSYVAVSLSGKLSHRLRVLTHELLSALSCPWTFLLKGKSGLF